MRSRRVCRSASWHRRGGTGSCGYPRQTLEFFKRRIAREESSTESKQVGYASVSFFDVPALDGLEQEEDFAAIAKSLLTEFLCRPSDDRHPWRQLFIMAVSRTSSLVERLLLEILPDVNTWRISQMSAH